MMRKIALFEEYTGNGGNYSFTENQIENLLDGFEGSEFFEFDLEKSKVDLKYPVKVETEDYENGVEGKIEAYLYDTYYKTDPKFIEAIKKRLNVSEERDEDLESLTRDLDDVGFSDKKKVTWEEIKKALDNMIDKAYFSFLSIDLSSVEFATEMEQFGMEFRFRIYMARYTGDVAFDNQDFVDSLITDLFYNNQ